MKNENKQTKQQSAKPMLLFFLLFITPFLLQAQESSISAEIEKGTHIEYQPLKGLITVTHDKSAPVDTNSFRMQGKTLEVELMQEVPITPTSPLVVSFYRFTLPGTIRGLHKLPSISVKVGNQTLNSVASTFTVGQLATGDATSSSSLNLETIIEGSPQPYPGQHVRVGYRYIYSGSIELTDESLPLLDAKGFLKVGAKDIKDYAKDKVNVREITQEIEATKPGKYEFPPSSVSGNAYTQDVFGRRTYLQPRVQAGTPSMTIEVLAFPDTDKPASFNGAVGPFDKFKVRLLSSPKVNVGDKVILGVEIEGKGQLENVPLPELCCQPGFSGQFALSDLPPVEVMKGPQTKQFTVEMRVLTANISQIPPVEFAYFDPTEKQYKILKSETIPLTVAALAKEKPPTATQPVDTEESHGDVAKKLAPIEIVGIKSLSVDDLSNIRLGTWNVFWMLPLALVAWLLQLNYFKLLQQDKGKPKLVTAKERLDAALSAPTLSPEFYHSISKALLLRLKEQGRIANDIQDAHALPEEGVAGKVRAFLLRIEEARFSGQEVDIEVSREAKTLFEEI